MLKEALKDLPNQFQPLRNSFIQKFKYSQPVVFLEQLLGLRRGDIQIRVHSFIVLN